MRLAIIILWLVCVSLAQEEIQSTLAPNSGRNCVSIRSRNTFSCVVSPLFCNKCPASTNMSFLAEC